MSDAIEVRDDDEDLAAYARIPIAFETREVLEVAVVDGGLGGLALCPRPLPAPFRKDYDAIGADRPHDWPARFGAARLVVLSAWLDGERTGGAAVVRDSPSLRLLRGRPDDAVLWDLRVAPAARGRGVGRALVVAARRSAASLGAGTLGVETQNVNVPACRFYARCGFTLAAIEREAYAGLPGEARLIWEHALDRADDRSRRTDHDAPTR